MEAQLERLRETVASFVNFIASLPAQDLAPATWGPREVLIHFVFWHETMVSTIQALLAARTPDLPRCTFAELNAGAVAANRDLPVDRLLHRLQVAQSQLERLATEDAARSLAIPIKHGSVRRSIDELITEVEAHIRNHQAKLQRQLHRRV